MIGLWKTDAPISIKQWEATQPELNSLWAALDGVIAYADTEIVLDEVTVYINGVKWTYEARMGDFGR